MQYGPNVEIAIYRMTNMKFFVAALVISAVVLSIFGFRIDRHNFGINILAGLAVMLFGFAFALIAVDKYSAYLRAKRWKQVRDITMRQIAVHLTELFVETFSTFGVKIF